MCNVVGSRENKCLMNLFAWLVECAHAVKLTCYMETVVDSETLHSLNWPLVLRCRLFVPVPTEYVEPLLDRMRVSLNATVAVGDSIEGEGSSVSVRPGRASPTVTPKTSGGWDRGVPLSCIGREHRFGFGVYGSTVGGGWDSKDAAGSDAPVDFSIPAGLGAAVDPTDLLFGDDGDDAEASAAIEAALSAGMRDEEANDEIDRELCDEVSAFSSRSPLSLLRAEHMFTPELCGWDAAHGADQRQLRYSNYCRDGRLMFPSGSKCKRDASGAGCGADSWS